MTKLIEVLKGLMDHHDKNCLHLDCDGAGDAGKVEPEPVQMARAALLELGSEPEPDPTDDHESKYDTGWRDAMAAHETQLLNAEARVGTAERRVAALEKELAALKDEEISEAKALAALGIRSRQANEARAAQARAELARDEAMRERDAYKKAKQENDERFCNERDTARQERDVALKELEELIAIARENGVEISRVANFAAFTEEAKAAYPTAPKWRVVKTQGSESTEVLKEQLARVTGERDVARDALKKAEADEETLVRQGFDIAVAWVEISEWDGWNVTKPTADFDQAEKKLAKFIADNITPKYHGTGCRNPAHQHDAREIVGPECVGKAEKP